MSLLLNATGLEVPGRISRVEFINLHGDVLSEIPTPYYDTRPALYNVSNIVAPDDFFYIKVWYTRSHTTYTTAAPCGLRGCKNWPAPFPGRMSYKATKPGLAVCHILACFYCIVVY